MGFDFTGGLWGFEMVFIWIWAVFLGIDMVLLGFVDGIHWGLGGYPWDGIDCCGFRVGFKLFGVGFKLV